MRFEKWQALGNDYLIVEAAALPWELTAGADPAALRSALRGRLRRRPAALAGEDPALRRRAADLQPRRLRGRALRQRRPRGDPLPAPRGLDRRGRVLDPHRGRADHADDHLRADLHGRDGPGRRRPRRTSRPAAADGRGELEAGGREWRFQHVSIGNPQCAIEVGDGARGARPGRDRPGDREQRALPEPHQRLASSGSTATGSGRGSSSAGWGRRSPPGTGASGAAVAAFLRGAPSPITVELDGGELEVEIGDDLDVRLTGWAEPVYAGELSPELRAGAEARGRSPSPRLPARWPHREEDGPDRALQAPGGDARRTCSPSSSGGSPTSATRAST